MHHTYFLRTLVNRMMNLQNTSIGCHSLCFMLVFSTKDKWLGGTTRRRWRSMVWRRLWYLSKVQLFLFNQRHYLLNIFRIDGSLLLFYQAIFEIRSHFFRTYDALAWLVWNRDSGQRFPLLLHFLDYNWCGIFLIFIVWDVLVTFVFQWWRLLNDPRLIIFVIELLCILRQLSS